MAKILKVEKNIRVEQLLQSFRNQKFVDDSVYQEKIRIDTHSFKHVEKCSRRKAKVEKSEFHIQKKEAVFLRSTIIPLDYIMSTINISRAVNEMAKTSITYLNSIE